MGGLVYDCSIYVTCLAISSMLNIQYIMTTMWNIHLQLEIDYGLELSQDSMRKIKSYNVINTQECNIRTCTGHYLISPVLNIMWRIETHFNCYPRNPLETRYSIIPVIMPNPWDSSPMSYFQQYHVGSLPPCCRYCLVLSVA